MAWRRRRLRYWWRGLALGGGAVAVYVVRDWLWMTAEDAAALWREVGDAYKMVEA